MTSSREVSRRQALPGQRRGALLELCETPSCDGKLVLFVGGESARAEIGVWYGGASAFSIYEIKPRNVIIACLIALGAIEPKP